MVLFAGARKMKPIAGFTMIELLCVIVIVGSLVSSALPQFLNFTQEAKMAAVSQGVQALREAVKLQHLQGILKCNKPITWWPSGVSVEANDITAGGFLDCTPAQIPNPDDRKFIAGTYPTNPFTKRNTMLECEDASRPDCNQQNQCRAHSGDTCDRGSMEGTVGWCYDDETGNVWASSGRSITGTLECSL
jgi:prepilin-type N-terminal cleavage/methylation domain-containing protein